MHQNDQGRGSKSIFVLNMHFRMHLYDYIMLKFIVGCLKADEETSPLTILYIVVTFYVYGLLSSHGNK